MTPEQLRQSLIDKATKQETSILKSSNISKTTHNDFVERISIEVVYEPDTPDFHSDLISQDELIKAERSFHDNWLAGNAFPILYHQSKTDQFEILNSWINYELDVSVLESGEIAKAGCWLCKIKYSPELWAEKTAGNIGGISLQASGYRDLNTHQLSGINFDPEYENGLIKLKGLSLCSRDNGPANNRPVSLLVKSKNTETDKTHLVKNILKNKLKQ